MGYIEQIQHLRESGQVKETGVPIVKVNENYAIATHGGFHRMDSLSGRDVDFSPWKFHISVDKADLSKAWDIVVNRLSTDTGHEYSAKAADGKNIGNFSNPQNPQSGKFITIVGAQSTDPAHNARILQEIEQDLRKAGVKPGPQVKGDRAVPGSSFLSYRNDGGGGKNYIAAEDVKHLPPEQRYNPTKSPDPYQRFSLAASAPHVPPEKPKIPTEGAKRWMQANSASFIPTNKGLYIPIEGLNTAQREALSAALSEHGVSHSSKISGSQGHVIAIDPKDVSKLAEALHPVQAVPHAQTPHAQTPHAQTPHAQTSHAQTPHAQTPHAPASSGPKGGVVGAATGVLVAGMTLANGASAAEAGHAAVAAVVPGYDGARRGSLCDTFGQLAGYVASGAVVAFGVTVTVPAAIASGPAAPAVGLGGAALTTAAAIGTDAAINSTTTGACKFIARKFSP